MKRRFHAERFLCAIQRYLIFFANVSHEMKTPLAVMQNYGTLLQTPGLPEDERIAYARAVADGARRLADLMTNILKLNRLENQQIYPQMTVYDLGEQLCECLLGYESVWEQKEIALETAFDDGVTIRADAELLALVKRIMDITGGEITVSSALGVGSAFTVRLGRNVA